LKTCDFLEIFLREVFCGLGSVRENLKELTVDLKYNFVLPQGRAIDRAVSRRLPNAAARVQNRVWSCGIL
jgi:hypothetical protein